MTKKRPTVGVSGGFDPVHVGHVRMILDAGTYGDVIVILNSDEYILMGDMNQDGALDVLDIVTLVNIILS